MPYKNEADAVAYRKAYDLKNRERQKKTREAYRNKNKARAKIWKAEHYKKHKARIRATQKAYQQAHRDQYIKRAKDYYKKNKVKMYAAAKAKRQTAEGRLKRRQEEKHYREKNRKRINAYHQKWYRKRLAHNRIVQAKRMRERHSWPKKYGKLMEDQVFNELVHMRYTLKKQFHIGENCKS